MIQGGSISMNAVAILTPHRRSCIIEESGDGSRADVVPASGSTVVDPG